MCTGIFFNEFLKLCCKLHCCTLHNWREIVSVAIYGVGWAGIVFVLMRRRHLLDSAMIATLIAKAAMKIEEQEDDFAHHP